MPTGYTDAIRRGITFQQFALDCARAFGACITLRDEAGGGEKIPEKFEPSDYHLVEGRNARERLSKLRAMTDTAAAIEANREREEAEVSNAKYRREQDETRAKYEAMLQSVRAWVPPSAEHASLKAFMVEQIEGSIKFDCTPCEHHLPERDAATWRRDQIKQAERDILYHEEEHRKEVERARGRTEWVRALRESLA